MEKIDNQQKAKIISLIVLALVLITIWYMLDLVLLTFILTFIVYHIVEKAQKQYIKLTKVRLPDGFVLTIIYVAFVLVLIMLSGESFPRITAQFTWIADMFMKFDIEKVKDVVDPTLAAAMSHIDFNKYIYQAGAMLGTGMTMLGALAVNFFIAMILSFILLLEKKQIRAFGENLSKSKVSFIYEYFINFGGNFCNTFGKVMKVQVTIAFINSILSMIGLKIIGFDSVYGLGVMIFCLGLIPVAGVIMSLVPLSIIAFSVGGIVKIIEVMIMIAIIHSIESYILNPKLMASTTRLPVCFVFIILLVGEHYLGVWGLLIGVPIFIFAMNMLEVDYEMPKTERQVRRAGSKHKKK